MDCDMDPMMEPTEFFIWDDLVDPGKEYQCPNCGRLMDGSCIARSEENDCLVLWYLESH